MERKERRHHTREFKLEAVRLAAVGEKTKAKIARELGIRVNQLRQWRLDFEEEERPGRETKRPSPAHVSSYGLMFWFRWKRLPGSYFRLIDASLS